MAQSRLEKIGTIYSRISSLLKGGAMKDIDKPVWYTLYEAFPPKYEPCYARVAPKKHFIEILYKEDRLRMQFQRKNKNISTNLMNSERKSRTQEFISTYHEMKKSGVHENVRFQKSLEKVLQQRPSTSKSTLEDTLSETSIADSFKKEQKERGKGNLKLDINIKDILNS